MNNEEPVPGDVILTHEQFRELRAELEKARAEREAIRALLWAARPFVNLSCTQEQAEASPRWHSKAMAARARIDELLGEGG